MTQKGRPDQNGYAERVIRTIKEEEVELSDYQGYGMRRGGSGGSSRRCTRESGFIRRSGT